MRTTLSKVAVLAVALLCAAYLPAQNVQTMTFGSISSAPRSDITTGLVDMWMVRPGPCKLVSLFGYNNGPKQFVQIFDCPNTNGPILDVSCAGAGTVEFFMTTTRPSGLVTGTKLNFTNAICGLGPGVTFVGRYTNTSTSKFCLYDSLAHALAGGTTGLQIPSGGASGGYVSLCPIHTFAVAASDNFSMIIPVTGMAFGSGLAISGSSALATNSLTTKDFLFNVTVGLP